MKFNLPRLPPPLPPPPPPSMRCPNFVARAKKRESKILFRKGDFFRNPSPNFFPSSFGGVFFKGDSFAFLLDSFLDNGRALSDLSFPLGGGGGGGGGVGLSLRISAVTAEQQHPHPCTYVCVQAGKRACVMSSSPFAKFPGWNTY